jgi:membrane protein YdbS with pleckstrin-like domain
VSRGRKAEHCDQSKDAWPKVSHILLVELPLLLSVFVALLLLYKALSLLATYYFLLAVIVLLACCSLRLVHSPKQLCFDLGSLGLSDPLEGEAVL